MDKEFEQLFHTISNTRKFIDNLKNKLKDYSDELELHSEKIIDNYNSIVGLSEVDTESVNNMASKIEQLTEEIENLKKQISDVQKQKSSSSYEIKRLRGHDL